MFAESLTPRNVWIRVTLLLMAMLTTTQLWAGKVLIYGPSLNTNVPNEQTVATSAGHSVTVVDAVTWSRMTSAQFASFDAIVFGDPGCSNDTSPLANAVFNDNIWAPIVTGRKIIIGTDPVFHFQEGTTAAGQLMTSGINFAASGPGTGLYASLSCYFVTANSPTRVNFLRAFGQIQVLGTVGCDNIHIVDTNISAMAGLTDEALSNWGCSMHEWFTSFPSSFTIVAIETTGIPAIKPYIIAAKETLSERAAALARTLNKAPYLLGAKGFDWQDQNFVFSKLIHDPPGYHYSPFNATLVQPGVDCSGLVFWAYNKAAGATEYIPCDGENPVSWEGADQQFRNNFQLVVNGPDELKPGDLLFFNYGEKPSGQADHVAMYIGATDEFPNGAITEAYCDSSCTGTPIGIITSKCSALSVPVGCERTTQDPVVSSKSFVFLGFRRRTFPVENVKLCTHSPIDLVVTDPDGITITAQTVTKTLREELHEVPAALYYSEWQTGTDGRPDAMVRAPLLKSGDYLVQVTPKPGASLTETYSLDLATSDDRLIHLATNVQLKNIPAAGYGFTVTGGTVTPFVSVAIDIKPGQIPNSINPNSNGKIPVAILSTSTFDASIQIDQNSVTFGRTGNEISLSACHAEDANGDGLFDLVCHFNTQNTGFVSGDTIGILKATTIDGTLVRGTDSVNIVLNKKQ